MAAFQGCLICLQPAALKAVKLLDDDNFKDVSQFNDGLNVMFVLKSVLGLPPEEIGEYLRKHGSPGEWGIRVCGECQQKYCDRATALQGEESRIQKEFEKLRKEVQGHVHNSCLAEQVGGGGQASTPTKGKGRGKRKSGPDKPGPVFNGVRKWVVDKGDPAVKNGIDEAIDMAGGINNYIEHLMAETAFKTLGPGRKLADPSLPGPSSAISGIAVSSRASVSISGGSDKDNQNKSTVVSSSPPSTNHTSADLNSVDVGAANVASEQKRAAAAAALARFDKEKARKPNVDSKELLASRQSAFIKEQVRKELEQEKLEDSTENGQGPSNNETVIQPLEIPKKVIDPANYVVQGVFYRCPEIGLHTPLPKAEVEKQIHEYLTNQIRDGDEETPYHVPIQIINSCNKPLEKVNNCIDLLWKIIDNIIQNPTDHKFRQIKCSKRAFKENIHSVYGGELLLKTAAFRKDMVPNMDTWNQEEEECWVFDPEDDITYQPELIKLRNLLRTTPPIKPVLDRNPQILLPQHITSRSELPDEFYALGKDEIKRMQQSKTELAERELTLRTKAMRERDEIQERRIYRFGVMRIRFPDTKILQGTFNASDKLSELFKFVRDSMMCEFQFDLIQPGGGVLDQGTDMTATLAELNFLPSTLFNFRGGEDTPEGVLSGGIPYLNTNLMDKLEDYMPSYR